MTSNLATIEAKAERCGVETHLSSETGRRVIRLYGRSKDIENVLRQIHGYHFRWQGSDFGDPPPEHEPDDTVVVSLYSDRTNWAEAGY